MAADDDTDMMITKEKRHTVGIPLCRAALEWWRNTEPNPHPLFELHSSTLALRGGIRRFGHTVSKAWIFPPDPPVQLFVLAVLADLPILECIEVFRQFSNDVS